MLVALMIGFEAIPICEQKIPKYGGNLPFRLLFLSEGQREQEA